MKLIFATNNQHKVEEMRAAVGDAFVILSIKDAGINIDIPEPYDTLEENASEKSKRIYELTGQGCFSEDTGLEVFALNGEPGVKSARYAGEGRSFDDNIEKMLYKLAHFHDRKARFRAVISLIIEGKEWLFEGVSTGTILPGKKGIGGFGYDPVFLPDGANHTFAEMKMEEKTKFSHRKKAADKLVTFLKQLEIKAKI